jgi:putative aldouronate transport system substrate-binding protein
MGSDRRTIAITVVAVLLVAGVSAFLLFRSDSRKAESASLAPVRINTPGELPIVEEPFTLTFCTRENYPPSPSYQDQLLVWRVLEERTNVRIEFLVPENYERVMATKIASGDELPDILRVPGDDPMPFAYAGTIVALTDLIGRRAPHTVELLAAKPDLRRRLTSPDGEIYVLGKDVAARTSVNYLSFGVRVDWLNKLGISEPDTLDDWANMLTSIRDNDLNGNGRQDEIPFSTYEFNRLFIFGGAYGLHLTHSGGWYVEDGEVRYEWILPEMKELLRLLREWYSKNLIDAEVFSQSYEKYATKATSGILGATEAFTMQYPMWNIEMSGGNPEGLWGHVQPPAGPAGTRLLEKEQPVLDDYYGISRDCSRPDVAVQWLDYMYASRDGQILMTNFGVEEVTYEVVNGEPLFLPGFLSHPKGTGVAQWELGMNGPFPGVIMPEMIEQRFRIFPEHYRKAESYRKYHVSSFPRLPSTGSESSLIDRVMWDVETYVREMCAKFVSGEIPLSEFDRFVQRVDDLGIRTIVDVKQQQYDRFLREAM